MYKHKTMRDRSAKGKCTMGCFYGFKLHLIINDKGEIIQWMLTSGNTDDRYPLKDKHFTKRLFGKLFTDKGYISQSLFEELFIDDIHMTTKLRRNMKNSIRKKSTIETVNDELKNVCHIEHTRHRSFDNCVTNLISVLITYQLMPQKTTINIEIIDKNKLIA